MYLSKIVHVIMKFVLGDFMLTNKSYSIIVGTRIQCFGSRSGSEWNLMLFYHLDPGQHSKCRYESGFNMIKLSFFITIFSFIIK